ncbi:MAG: T9SS type A sorting domain-containing protein [Bacteroidetes bacterium]|nr:T9SS type A sorting domain-containing protein [Bacteroidota bacterium]
MNSQTVTWQKILSNYSGRLVKAIQTSDNGFITVGTGSVLNSKVYLQKFNYHGDSLWVRLFGNLSQAYDGNWVENTFDNGFIVCGSDANSPNSDGYLVKTDSFGNLIWDNNFGGLDFDQAKCVKQTTDSGYILILRTYSFNGIQNIWLIKTNKQGNKIWENVFVSNSSQIAREIIVLKDGYGIIGVAFNDIYFIRTDLKGDILWTKRYGTSYLDAGYSIQSTIDNGFIIGGISYNSNNISNSLIIKTDSIGEVHWQKSYTANYNELLFSVRIIPNKGYVFCGTTDSVKGNLEKGFVRIINFNGDVLHEKFYRVLPFFTEIHSIENTNDKGFIICGVAQNIQGGNPQMYIAKTDSTGNINPVGISNYSETIPIQINLHQNYPNPFNPSTLIKFDINKSMNVNLSIFDINGKKILNLIDEYLNQGNYEILFQPDIHSLSSSVYFYRLETPFNVSTRKMLFLK